jgi:hypothetical protein
MGRSTEQKAEKMSVYFNPKKAAEQQEEEIAKELHDLVEEEQKKEAAQQVVKALVQLFVDPLITMLVWNWVVPGLFGLAAIGYWQAFALCWLCRILFKNQSS